MPLKKCSENEKEGWKWGDQGKCYIGKDAKKQAIRQGISIEGPEKFSKLMKSESNIYKEEKNLVDSLIESTQKNTCNEHLHQIKKDIEEYLNENNSK